MSSVSAVTPAEDSRPSVVKTTEPDASDPVPMKTIKINHPSSVTSTLVRERSNSMTLAITARNANRMLEASRSLNAALKAENIEQGTKDNVLVAEKLIPSAKKTANALLLSFVKSMEEQMERNLLSREEMILCLLLFLDCDKSSKLLMAFEVLSANYSDQSSVAKIKQQKQESLSETSASNVKDIGDSAPEVAEVEALPKLKRAQLKKMFQSFLLSISTCINYKEASTNNIDKENFAVKSIKMKKGDSPGSSKGIIKNDDTQNLISSETRREVEEIANYAADRIINDIQEQKADDADKSVTNGDFDEIINVEFQLFGEWYNNGGFSLVPWLELLDLAKWDYAGRAAAAANKVTFRGNKSTSTHQAPSEKMINSECNSDFPSMPDLFLQSPMPSKSLPRQNDPLNKVLLSFEFGSVESRISIRREHLLQLKRLVDVTEFSSRSPEQVVDVLLRHSHHSEQGSKLVISKKEFNSCIYDIIPPETKRTLTRVEMDALMNRFNCFFFCFRLLSSKNEPPIAPDCVHTKELAVGLSFLCSGNKSAKLASTFDLIGDPNTSFVSQTGILRYFESYLTMLLGISLLSSSDSITIETLNGLVSVERGLNNMPFSNDIHRSFGIVQRGALWTVNHFKQKCNMKKVFFEDLANWYTSGGFSVAPWLEFLDLKKFMSFLCEGGTQHLMNPSAKMPNNIPCGSAKKFTNPFAQSPTMVTASSRKQEQKDILFTFPLAKNESLIVLREDAAYVRTVVDHLGLLNLTPQKVWNSLLKKAKHNAKGVDRAQQKNQNDKSILIDQQIFVDSIEKTLPAKSKRKRSSSSQFSSTSQETLQNFFQSFDLNQINQVAANQLMGGFTLLCGGNKSDKLSFAFELFDTRSTLERKTKAKRAKKKQSISNDKKSLCGKELFYFFRSFLIVMFSCCKQSLDLSAESVNKYISDTANKVTDDVMKFQLRVRNNDRVTFDDFGEWYNEGGFEAAPWLELLDLNKWVLLDKAKADKLMTQAKPMQALSTRRQLVGKNNDHTPQKIESKQGGPHLPSDHEIDNTDVFLDDIEMDGIGGDIGDMAFLFPETEGIGKENVNRHQRNAILGSSEPSPYRTHVKENNSSNALKFELYTNESTVFTASISQERVRLLRHIVIDSNLCTLKISYACNKILEAANGKQITRGKFNNVTKELIDDSKMSDEARQLLSDLFNVIFNAFDFNKSEKADANELACGLTVLCGGSKSDKLELAFDLLDKKREKTLNRFQMVRYLQSFLLVLLNISSCPLGPNASESILCNQEGEKAQGSIALARVICGTSSWAAEKLFNSTQNEKKKIDKGIVEHIDFDKFADWYTSGGYNRIAWLELLDLKKWVLME